MMGRACGVHEELGELKYTDVKANGEGDGDGDDDHEQRAKATIDAGESR